MDLESTPGSSARARRSSARSLARSRRAGTRGARASPLARGPVRAAPCEGRARGRSELPPITITKVECSSRSSRRAVPRDSRSLDAPHSSATSGRSTGAAPCSRCSDAQQRPQPPGADPCHGPPARRALGEARAARRDPHGPAAGGQGARVHAVPRLRPARAAPRSEARPRRRASSTAGSRPAHGTSASPGSSRRATPPCSSSRCAPEAAG